MLTIAGFIVKKVKTAQNFNARRCKQEIAQQFFVTCTLSVFAAFIDSDVSRGYSNSCRTFCDKYYSVTDTLQVVQNYVGLSLSHSSDRSGTGTRSVPSSFSVPLTATVLVIFPSNRRISFSIILSFYLNLMHVP